MTLACALRSALSVAMISLLLAGCANLPFMKPKTADAPAAAASGAEAGPTHADYRLEVDAPSAALRTLLSTYLDLARFQNAPASAAITDVELERLLLSAPAQARGLLETEGYFNVEVRVARSGDRSDALPLVRVVVVPGQRASVRAFTFDVVGALQTAADHGDAAAQREIDALRSQWPLRGGSVFREAAWSDAKNGTLARLRADGWASASWHETSAQVDAPANAVSIALVLDSGPLYRLGALRIEGLTRYDDNAVRQLANFHPGDAYSEKLLLDFQDRLQKLGLFEGASVELQADAGNADAAPVVVRVKELPRQQVTTGIGYSANTGPRVTLEHIERKVFGRPWIAKNNFEYGPDNKSWTGELSTYPLSDLYRNLISGSASKILADDDQWQTAWNARIGRTQDTPRIGRLYFAEIAHARVDSAELSSQAEAISGNYHWVWRDVDSVLLPTRGITLSAQGGVGLAHGSRSVLDDPLVEARGPFARLYSRLTFYRPLGDAWFGTARIEAGQVFAHSAVGVPDTLLFRAGGDDSVRGYGYRTLGPQVHDITLSGRNLLTGSVEIAHPISPRTPTILWAAFVDAGNAADRWQDLKPDYGYGLGLRVRSPVGPLRVDVAYGQQVHQVRLHLSVGVAF